ncbi:hypothetical protein [Nostocoides australiense]
MTTAQARRVVFAGALVSAIAATNRRTHARDLPSRAALALPVAAAGCGALADRGWSRARMAGRVLSGLGMAHVVGRPLLAGRQRLPVSSAIKLRLTWTPPR